jgi:hypothetical protein
LALPPWQAILGMKILVTSLTVFRYSNCLPAAYHDFKTAAIEPPLFAFHAERKTS